MGLRNQVDGYRAIAVKADGRVNLFSRRCKSFDHHYPLIVEALGELPEGTVVDGEIAAKTIILTIQKTATKVDTSPQALIQLKTAGMSDAVLNAVLTASSAPATDVKVNQSTQHDCSQALDKVLASVGSPEKIASVHSSNLSGRALLIEPPAPAHSIPEGSRSARVTGKPSIIP